MSSLRRTLATVILLTTSLICISGCGTSQFTIVKQSQSPYTIHHDAKAPASVKLAAGELQRLIRESTGAELPIRTEPADRMICLGENDSSRAAGLAVDDLEDDGFLIRTIGDNVYIVGRDSAEPLRWHGWPSRGTLYGTYEFLERVVGVRWLMPGEWGEDIPKHSALSVPRMNVKQEPDFMIRSLVDVQDKHPGRSDDGKTQPSEIWLRRHRIVSTEEGRKLEHGHAWVRYITPRMLEDHPEYGAVSGGRYKICTTSPQVIDSFASNVIKRLYENPSLRCASISPTDGGNFCQCPNCQALVTKDPHGKPSYTMVMLTFANEIARRVAAKHPDRIVAHYVYYNYMYPPEQPVKIEPNLYLVWAPLNYYGYGLYKPVYKEEFERVLAGWLKLTRNFVYHNYSTWMRSFNGAPLPPGFDILKLEVPALKKHGVVGAEMLGKGAWGYGGPSNYVQAKQLWDTSLDVEALFVEWLQRAYGPGWKTMHDLYMMIGNRFKDWKVKETPKYSGMQYEVNYDVIDNVYRPVFADMERLYLDALSKVETEAQRKRLEMFGDNLIMLHHGMRHAGMELPKPEKSSFYRTDEKYEQFLKDTEWSIALYRNHGKRYTSPIWKGEWSAE